MNKSITFNAAGNPAQVAQLIEYPEAGKVGANQIEIAMRYAPINPSDLLFMAGRYGLQAQFPQIAGFEGVAEVVQVGANVKNVVVGDHVLYPQDGQSYSTSRTVPADVVFALPQADLEQLAMLQINPVTAFIMLTEFKELNAGDWLVQSGANSAVGRAVIAIAKARGYRTLNVVRRPELVAELKALGADEVVVGVDELRAKQKEILGPQGAKLALDSVGKETFTALSDCLGFEGVLVPYGVMSGEGDMYFTGPTIFKNLTIKGFWLVSWLKRQTQKRIEEVVLELAQMIADGTLYTPIEKRYSLDQAQEAFAHALKSKGKILFENRA